MATIVGLNQDFLDKINIDCPKCSDDFDNFIFALMNIDSKASHYLELLGYVPLDTMGVRRHHRYKLRRCDGIFGFYWKKKKIEFLDLFCDSPAHRLETPAAKI